MSAPETRIAQSDSSEASRFRRELRLWVPANIPKLVRTALWGAILGFALQVLMLRMLGGDDALLFCASILGPLFGWVAYARAVGTARFARAVSALPKTIAAMFRGGGRRAGAHFFLGAAFAAATVSVFAVSFDLSSTWVISRYTFPAYAFACVGVALSPLGPLLTQTLTSVFKSFSSHFFERLFERLAPPGADERERPDAMSIALLGAALAWLIGFWVNNSTKHIWTLTFAAVGLLMLLSRKPGSREQTLVIGATGVLLGQVIWDLLAPLMAHAMELPRVRWDCLSFTEMSGGRAPGGLLCSRSYLGPAAGVLGGGAGAAIGRAVGEVAARGPATRPDGKPEDDLKRKRERYVDDWNRLNELDANIGGDPELARRIRELRERARADGRFDPDELARLGNDVDRLGKRRRQEIDEQHGRFTEDFRKRQDERESEAEKAKLARERERQARIDHGMRLIEQERDPERQEWLRDFFGRHTRPDDDGRMPGDDAIERAIAAIRRQRQNRLDSERDDALNEADAAAAAQKTAEGVRDWANRVNRELARRVPGGQLVHSVQNVLTDGVRGYEEGGIKGMVKRGAANILDNYTAGGASAGLDTQIEGGGAGDFVGHWAENRFGQFDPRTYVDKMREARKKWDEGDYMSTLGDLADSAQSARDAREEFHRGVDARKRRRGGEDAQAAPHAASPSDERPVKPVVDGVEHPAARRASAKSDDASRPRADDPHKGRVDHGEERTSSEGEDKPRPASLSPEEARQRREAIEKALRDENEARRRARNADAQVVESGGESESYAARAKAKRELEQAREHLRELLDQEPAQDRRIDEPQARHDEAASKLKEAESKLAKAEENRRIEERLNLVDEARAREERLRKRLDDSDEGRAALAHATRERIEAERTLRQSHEAVERATAERDRLRAERDEAAAAADLASPRRSLLEAGRERSGETPDVFDNTNADIEAEMNHASRWLLKAQDAVDKAALKRLRDPNDARAQQEFDNAVKWRDQERQRHDSAVDRWQKSGEERGRELNAGRDSAQARLERANQALEAAQLAEQQAREAPGATQADIAEASRKREAAEVARDAAYDERVKAGEREREAANQMHAHLEAESAARDRIDGAIRKTFGLPEPGPDERPGTLRIDDQREVQSQSRTGSLPVLGSNEPGSERSRSVASEHVAIHERVHAAASTTFDKEYPVRGDSKIAHLKEGITEHFAQQVVADLQKAGGPVLPSAASYSNEVRMVQSLERIVGRENLSNAYFKGNLGDLHASLGRAFGADESNSRASGQKALAEMDVAMSAGRHKEVQRVLELLESKDVPGARAAMAKLGSRASP